MGVGLLVAVAMPGCKREPTIVDRSLVVNSPLNCPVSQSIAYGVIYGNGDFDNPDDAVSSLYLKDTGSVLSELPAATRSVIVDVSHPTEDINWTGTAEVPSSGPVNVLVWPVDETCRLTRNVEPRTDVTLGVFGDHIMVAGGNLVGAVPHTFVGDLSTGIVEALGFGLGVRRSRASITAFRTSSDQEPSPALVAGGEDPDTQTPIGTAEVYLPDPTVPGALGDFVAERIDLSEPRTRHGSVVLATGETLLVGGTGQFGSPLATMEIVSPVTRRYRSNGVALLAVPRTNPTVLRLASGEILVAGGFDRANAPVPTLEWFSADASRASKRPIDLVTGRQRAFIPLEAGGALAVIIPSDGDPAFKTVWVISADGTLEPGLPVDPATLDNVRLFQGSDGAPVLWTGSKWLRWEPWFALFQPIANAPSKGPSGTGIVNGDSGLALWLDDSVENFLFVSGYRFATRSRFGTVHNPLLLDSTVGLAPDRISGAAGSSIHFDPSSGLQLGSGASAFVTDVTFADVGVVADTQGSPVIVLRQENGSEVSVGGAECPYSRPPELSLRVDRAGTRVSYQIDGGDTHVCQTALTPGSRVTVGVRGGDSDGFSYVRNLRITRQ